MLKLSDFYHLPELDTAVGRIIAEGPGLILIAGMDTRSEARPGSSAEAVLPSGRATFFRTLVGEVMDGMPDARGIIVSQSPDVVRIPNQLRSRLRYDRVQKPIPLADRIRRVIGLRPDLLVVERIDEETAAAVLEAANSGIKVIAQLDSIFRGAGITRQLRDLGATADQLDCLTWVVSVERLATLCQNCRQPAASDASQLDLLLLDAPPQEQETFWHAPGCDVCNGTGRRGDVALFDIFRFPDSRQVAGADPRVLPIDRYARALASAGMLSFDEVRDLSDDQLRRISRMLTTSEHALAETNSALRQKVAELEAANRVLQQRTEALVSLHDVGQNLLSTTDLGDLASRIWRHTRALCGTDRAVFFWRMPDDTAQVMGLDGWPRERVQHTLPAAMVFDGIKNEEPTTYRGWPPGVLPRHADVEGGDLRAGLRVPLFSEGRLMGVMFVHSTRKARFAPGEVALIRTLASQGAMALRRAELVDELYDKIAKLETAQAALVERERFEREMELARDVQQSMLPTTLPDLPSLHFAARNRPAQQVGGDLFDVFWLDENHIGIVIADVSGKGMPAALYMALTRSLLVAEARRERSTRGALLSVNQLLRSLGEPRMFVTVFYGVISVNEQRLCFTRAGHDYPLLFRDGQMNRLEGEGTVLGFLPSSELNLSEEELELRPNDRLVLYTDGLTDIVNTAGKRFNPEGLQAVLSRHRKLTADGMIAATFDDLDRYQGSAAQYDDMTMLVVEVASLGATNGAAASAGRLSPDPARSPASHRLPAAERNGA